MSLNNAQKVQCSPSHLLGGPKLWFAKGPRDTITVRRCSMSLHQLLFQSEIHQLFQRIRRCHLLGDVTRTRGPKPTLRNSLVRAAWTSYRSRISVDRSSCDITVAKRHETIDKSDCIHRTPLLEPLFTLPRYLLGSGVGSREERGLLHLLARLVRHFPC